jgi:hypothetical protein
VHHSTSACPLCPITEGLCFWGEQAPHDPWKRKILPWLSMAALALLLVAWVPQDRPPHWLAFVLSAVLLVFAAVGLASSLWGCNRCVVRVWGHS